MNLILFFNGWGMDKTLVNHLPLPKNYHLKIINYPYKIEKIKESYKKIIYVGYSFGVYYLAKFLSKSHIHFSKAIAINGTPEIIGKYGISPKIFRKTFNELSEDSIQIFFKTMVVSENFQKPSKTMEELKIELESLMINYQPQTNCFNQAFISERDKIIPSKRQIAYFQEKNITISKISSGHYPFSVLNSWEKIIRAYLYPIICYNV
jgi:biotin synthesis protein BioG